MDIIENFYESKSVLDELCKNLFLLFEQNDKFGIIKTSDIKYLDLSESKHSNLKIVVNLYNYNDVLPRETMEFDREVLLNCDEQTIRQWIERSKEIIEKIYISKLNKFYKDFSGKDFVLIHAGIVNYKTLCDKMTDNEIAKYIANYVIENEENK